MYFIRKFNNININSHPSLELLIRLWRTAWDPSHLVPRDFRRKTFVQPMGRLTLVTQMSCRGGFFFNFEKKFKNNDYTLRFCGAEMAHHLGAACVMQYRLRHVTCPLPVCCRRVIFHAACDQRDVPPPIGVTSLMSGRAIVTCPRLIDLLTIWCSVRSR